MPWRSALPLPFSGTVGREIDPHLKPHKVRLQTMNGVAAARGVAGESQARGADLASGRAEGAEEAAPAWAAVAGGWVLRAPAAPAPQSCLGV